jgi:repressor LexA
MNDSTLKLTARQSQILQLIQTSISRTGAPPTRAEIAQELGFKSANAAEEHLQALARKGAIELVSGTSRGIRLRSQDLQTINDARDRQMSLPLAGLSQLMLPLIGRVAAGSPILAQEHVDQTYHVERSLFTRQPDYLLKVRGMSMRDAGIMDGDLLAVHATQDVKNGQIVVARLGMPSNSWPKTPITKPSWLSPASPLPSKASPWASSATASNTDPLFLLRRLP